MPITSNSDEMPETPYLDSPVAKLSNVISTGILDIGSEKELAIFLGSVLKEIVPYTCYILFDAGEAGSCLNVRVTDLQTGGQHDLSATKILPDEPFFFEALHQRGVRTYVTTALPEGLPVPAIVKEFVALNLKRFTLIPLHFGGKLSGALFLLSEKTDLLVGSEALLNNLSFQLSGCLYNLSLLNVVEKMKFKEELLLSILDEITVSPEKDLLLDMLRERLQVFLPFRDILVSCIDPDRKFYSTFMHSFEEPRKNHPGFQKILSVTYPVTHRIIKSVTEADEPLSFPIRQLAEPGEPTCYYDFYNATGIAKITALPLKNEKEVIGILYFTMDEGGVLAENNIFPLQTVASHLAIAVSNMQARTLITERDYEKSVLLSLSSNIATIKDHKQLLQLLLGPIKKLLHFDDVVITLYNFEYGTHGAYLFSCEDRRTQEPDFEKVAYALSPITDGVVNQTLLTDNPIIFKTDEVLRNEFVPEYVRFYKRSGIEEFTGTAMRNKDGVFGGMYLLSGKQDTYHPRQFGLMKGIANLLSISVSNLLAYEEVIRKEREKSILLAISNDIATIKRKEDLLGVLHKRLNSIVYFDHAVIMLVDIARQVYSGYIFDTNSKIPERPEYKDFFRHECSMSDQLMKRVVAAGAPLVLDLSELIQLTDCPSFINLNYDCGMREAVLAQLHSGENFIGFLMLFSDTRNNFPNPKLELIRGLSYQLSNAVANIIANEEIMNRESEKSIQLSISNDLAAVRTKADLFQVIHERIMQNMAYSHTMVGKVSEDGNWMTGFIFDPKSPTKKHPDYQEVTASKFNINDGLIDVAFATGRPHRVDLAEQSKKGDLSVVLKMNYNSGVKEVLLVGLSNGQRRTGLLVIFSSRLNQINNELVSLIHGISSQLATAMANILANEKIEQQVDEISGFKKQLEDENLYLQEEIQTTNNYSEIIGMTPVLKKVFQLVSSVAPTTSSVLVLGETGTGKELIARAIHNTSPRRDKLMVKVNCATLPANLIESELFGHERGSFTGATDKRIGKFELANNSTLFLDEIGEMPLDLQVKLLRALQEKEIERVGGRTVIKTDVRIIAATNRDLQKEVLLGNFRSDLFFRLNVFPIFIPPLRDRKDDIPLLANHFLSKHAKKAGKKIIGFAARVMKELSAYNWPGNVRELEHLIERSILLATQQTITQLHLPVAEKEDNEAYLSGGFVRTIDDVEREHIMQVLKLCKGKVAGPGGAAEALKIPSTTLNSKIKRLGIRKEYMSE